MEISEWGIGPARRSPTFASFEDMETFGKERETQARRINKDGKTMYGSGKGKERVPF